MQRERYLKWYNISRCPRQYFIQDLVSFITSLFEGNNKIILTVDINEHTIDRRLLRELKSIRMIDGYGKKFNLRGLVSHITGSEPIDRVWMTNNITLSEVSIFPYKFSISDYRVILVNLDFD